VYGNRSKKSSLRLLKRRLFKVPGRSVSIDERLSGLTETMTIAEDADTRGNGESQEQQMSNHPGLL